MRQGGGDSAIAYRHIGEGHQGCGRGGGGDSTIACREQGEASGVWQGREGSTIALLPLSPEPSSPHHGPCHCYMLLLPPPATAMSRTPPTCYCHVPHPPHLLLPCAAPPPTCYCHVPHILGLFGPPRLLPWPASRSRAQLTGSRSLGCSR